MTIFVDPASNFHPYECDGPGECIHCDRMFITRVHDPATCELCQPQDERNLVTDQAAASASRKYVILENQSSGESGELGDLWAVVATVEAVSIEQAIKAQAAVSADWQGGTLVAVPERSWVPKTVKVETQKTVTLG